MRIKKHTKFTTLVALVATLVCALVAGVTLLTLPQTVMTANAEGEELTYSNFDSEWDALASGATFTLQDNWRPAKTITVPSGKTLTLDLNGKTIDGSQNGGYNVITIEAGGTLTLNDSSGNDSGKITGGNNNIDYNGGGIYVIGGEFIMNGGTIIKNYADFGGGVYVKDDESNNGVFRMKGGVIAENELGGFNSAGGGVCVTENGEFFMEDGTIRNNKSKGSGGGVGVDSFGNFTMTGGMIIGNLATGGMGDYGCGVHVDENSAFSVSGNPKIYNNKKQDEITLNNIKLKTKMTVGELSEDTELWITGNAGTMITSGYAEKNPGISPAKYFRADNGNLVLLSDGGEAYISDIPLTDTVAIPTLSTSEYDGTTPVKIDGYNKDTMEVSGLPEGWTVADDGTITIPENAEAKEYPFTITPKDNGYWEDGTQGAKEFKLTVKNSGTVGSDGEINSPVPWIVLVIVILVIASAITFTCVLIDRKNRNKNK